MFDKLLLFIMCLLWCLPGWSQTKSSKAASEMPLWAEKMYRSPSDPGMIIDAYVAYYGSHPFVKNQYTQDYKRWLRQLSILPDSLDLLSNNDDERIALKRNRELYLNRSMTMEEQSVAQASWQSLGPYDWDHEAAGAGYAPGAAHVYTVERSKKDSNLLFAGTATAGIWKTTDRGANWVSCTKNMMVSTVRALEISPFNDSVVYAGILSSIYMSKDAGASWTTTGDSIFNTINLDVRDLVAHPKRDSLIFAATKSGMYRSSNAGQSWQRILTAETQEIEMFPGKEDTMYAITYANDRTFFYKSLDAGLTWSLKSTGWPVPNIGLGDHQRRTEIAVTQDDTNFVLALATGKTNGGTGLFGIYSSNNAGESWTFSCCGPQPGGMPDGTTTPPNLNLMGWQDSGLDDGGQYYYDLALEISPSNKDSIFVCGVNQWVSADGGSTFVCPSKWSHPYKSEYVHADIHDVRAYGSDLWWACDGGVFFSSDRGKNIQRKMNGIEGTDFWGFGTGFWDGEVMLGGTYHNGTLLKNDSVYHNGWLNTNGGDQYRGFVNFGKEKQVYNDNNVKALPLNRLQSITTRAYTKKPNASYVIGRSSEIAFHPNCFNSFYVGEGNKLWRTDNDGHSFSAVYDFQEEVTEIEFAWSDPDVIYVCTWPGYWDPKKLYKTSNGGQTWTDITPSTSSFSAKRWIPYSIAVDGSNADILYLARASQSATAYDGEKVYKTVNGGSSWTNLTTSALDGENITHLIHQRGTAGGMYIGTRRAVYYRNDTMSDWVLFNQGLPLLTKTTRLANYYRKGKVRLGSNRSAYESPVAELVAPQAQIALNMLYNGCTKDSILFYDHSALLDSTASWLWSFPGGAPSVSTLRTPSVLYSQPGIYDVGLRVSNALGTDSSGISGLIEIGSECDLDTIPGLALNLESSGEHAELLTLNDSTLKITFAAWIKPDSIQASYSGIVFSKEEGAGLNIRPNMELGYHWPGGSWSWSSGLFIPVNQWSYVALVVDTTHISVFLNGIEARHNTIPQAVNFDEPLVAGIYKTWGSRTFRGLIDEVCVWNRPLSREELRLGRHLTKNPPTDSGLIAYYQFNEVSDALYNKVDQSAARIIGSATKTNSDGPFGGGTSSKINVSNGGPIHFTQEGIKIGFPATGTYPNGDLYATRINLAPDTKPNAFQLSSSYWIINNYGVNSTFSSLDSIVLENIDFNLGSAANYVLYKRSSNATGSTWGNPIDTGAQFSNNGRGTISFSARQRIDSFSQFIVSQNPGPPLGMLSIRLKGENLGKSIGLNWTAIEEQSFENFQIQKASKNQEFKTALTIERSTANENQIQTGFAWQDRDAIRSSQYYRIRGIGQDGKSIVSNTIIINSNSTKNPFKLYPNPAKSSRDIIISSVEAEPFTIKLYNSLGQELAFETDKKHRARISLSLAKGIYYLTIESNSHVQYEKLIINE